MNDIKKEFTSFEKFLKVYTKGIKVRDITRNYISKGIGSEYGNYTIEHFLILYKLSRMEELGVVSEKIANDLKEILDIKTKVGIMIGEEAKKELYIESYKSADLPKLHEMSGIINDHLKNYHLTIDDISLVDMIDAIIKEENNINIKEDNNIKVKRID